MTAEQKRAEIPDELRKSIRAILDRIGRRGPARAEMIENLFDFIKPTRLKWERGVSYRIEEPYPSQYQNQIERIAESGRKISEGSSNWTDLRDLIEAQDRANGILERVLEEQIEGRLEAERTAKIERVLTLIALVLAIIAIVAQVLT